MEVVDVDTLNKRKILVTGASGYIGGRLVRQLLRENLSVRVMVRDRQKISTRPWIDQVEVSVADAKDYLSTVAALKGIHTAVYLLHSMTAGPDFEKLEAVNARIFAKAAESAGIKQIIYLGGIANDIQISKHMKSRVRTGRILDERSVPVIEIRAGIIIGVGSASFEMLKDLIREIPFMTTPHWISNRTQPIGISDVLFYLSKAGLLRKPVKGIFDISGPDIFSYSKLFQTFAQLSHLRKRWVIKLPFPSPRICGHFVGLFTSVPTALARPLMGSLISEVVADPKKSLNGTIDPPRGGLLSVQTAIKLALTKICPSEVESRWSDLESETAPWAKSPSDPSWVSN